jgi:hypothetical protein
LAKSPVRIGAWPKKELETMSIVHDEHSPRQLDLPLIDYGQNAVETRLAAMKRQRSPMLLRVLEEFKAAGPSGLTRDEIAMILDRGVQSVCRATLDLINDGELVETKLRRPTRWGSPAAVLVHRDFREAVES